MFTQLTRTGPHPYGNDWRILVLLAISIGLVNALVRPVLALLTIQPRATIFIPVVLAVNVCLLWFPTQLSGNAEVMLSTILLISVGMGGGNLMFSTLLAIDDDDAYFQHLLRPMIRLSGLAEGSDAAGILFLEIDGLGEQVLRQAMAQGHMPTLSRWLASGSHELVGWECDLSSQTSASQAGILLGSNHDIPAYRWYEKDRRRQMVSSSPADIADVERRLSTGQGLLSCSGASRCNIFSGDGPRSNFTFSTVADSSRHTVEQYYPVFIGAFNLVRLLFLFILDLVHEYLFASLQRLRNERPRVYRGGIYPLVRASTAVILRELGLYMLMGDVRAGVPAVYATFFGYDEVAHHSGITRPDALNTLRALDAQFDRLERALSLAARPYHIVVLSDHGQSQGATFRQRHGLTLEELVRSLVSQEHTVGTFDSEFGRWGKASVILTDLLNDVVRDSNGLAASAIRRFAKQRTIMVEDRRLLAPDVPVDESKQIPQVLLGPHRQRSENSEDASSSETADLIVLPSGNLGLIYCTRWSERITFEQIEDTYPALLSGLTQHEGIGFLLVHSEKEGPMIVGKAGVHYLETGRISGRDPLEGLSPNAAAHLHRASKFPHAPDIMVNSAFNIETGEIAAFEELVGSHGGLGGPQSRPFLLYPAVWELEGEIVGAETLHLQLKKWLANAG